MQKNNSNKKLFCALRITHPKHIISGEKYGMFCRALFDCCLPILKWMRKEIYIKI